MRDVILTSIDESVVILLIGLCAVSLALEMHRGDTFGSASAVIVKRDILQGADRRMEQLLLTNIENSL